MPHSGLYPAALRPYRKSPRSPVPFLFQKPIICVHLCVKSAPDCHRMSHAPHTKEINMEQFETFFRPGPRRTGLVMPPLKAGRGRLDVLIGAVL